MTVCSLSLQLVVIQLAQFVGAGGFVSISPRSHLPILHSRSSFLSRAGASPRTSSTGQSSVNDLAHPGIQLQPHHSSGPRASLDLTLSGCSRSHVIYRTPVDNVRAWCLPLSPCSCSLHLSAYCMHFSALLPQPALQHIASPSALLRAVPLAAFP